MQNHLVHHLISTKLHCAPSKSAQNYIVNHDLRIHCQPAKYDTMRQCPYLPPEYVRCQRILRKCLWTPYYLSNIMIGSAHEIQTKSVRFVHVPYVHQQNRKNEKCWGWRLLPTDRSPLVHHSAQRGVQYRQDVFMCFWSGAPHKPRGTSTQTDKTIFVASTADVGGKNMDPLLLTPVPPLCNFGSLSTVSRPKISKEII